MPLAQLMNKPLATVAPGDRLSDAAAMMEKHDIHHLLVMDGNRMAGILSSADLLKLALLSPIETHGKRPACDALDTKVRDVMQTHVAVVRQNASLRDVARALSLGGFHALPVLATDGTPIGIVTSSDLIGLLLDQIERGERGGTSPAQPRPEGSSPSQSLLLDVLRAAEVYLHSGQSEQQHARLLIAVSRANEAIMSRPAN